jgi:lysine 2,3-aminomutase
MQDKIEKIGNSLIQHGKFNNRIYLMKLDRKDYPQIIKKLEQLAKSKGYTKIFGKVREQHLDDFIAGGYETEAYIPNFFGNGDRAHFIGKFFDEKRKSDIKNKVINKVINLAEEKPAIETPPEINPEFRYKVAEKSDASAMVKVYQEVFPTYPFPIHDPQYIRQTMDENVIYFGIWEKDRLVALSSAEMDQDEKNVEMTDFATLPEYRGNGFALFLLAKMEDKMKEMGIKTFYTIARAVSFGMNITFSKMGYQFTGTLKNNTNISGNIESMNVWYKHP